MPANQPRVMVAPPARKAGDASSASTAAASAGSAYRPSPSRQAGNPAGLLGQPLPQVARRRIAGIGKSALLAAFAEDARGRGAVISALRRKLGGSAGSLQTVRGAGYRFTAPH